jgi:RNA 2',3'-cyclic 3'-phosphodiesterase
VPARCFVSFDLSEQALDLLENARAAFLDVAPEWRQEKWVDRQLQHVTLKFIGPLPDDSVAGAVEGLARVAADFEPLAMEAAEVRAVPGAKRASMLWCTIGGEVQRCARLAREVDSLLAAEFGVEADERAYLPHATLVRVRRHRRAPADAIAAANAAIGAGKASDRFVSVPSITLWSSTLSSGPPVYQPLAEIPLAECGATC